MSNCNNTPCTNPTSDKCVIYTGPEIPELGICQGMKLSQVEAIVLEKLLEVTDGSSINLPTIVQACKLVQDTMQGKESTLENFVQALTTIVCGLDSRISTLEDQPVVVYDTKCLNVPNNTEGAIIQALINAVCSLNTEIEEVTNQIVGNNLTTTIQNTTGNMLHSSIVTCGDWGLIKTGSGSSAKVEIFGLVPPYSPIMCYAPLSNFDATGKGRPGGPFCGWYIMNGNNGIPDWQGYTPAMATNLPGIFRTKNLDARVGNFPIGSPYLSNLGDKKGEVLVNLTAANIPPHTHGVTQSPHNHTIPLAGNAKVGTVGSSTPHVNVMVLGHGNTVTSDSNANITIQSTGAGQPHYNVQPTVYCYFIVRLPEKPIMDVSYVDSSSVFTMS